MFGKICYVDPRTVWKHEANDFTPWLAENINELGEALYLDELEVIEREADVGDFSLDILAREVQSNAKVIIENQIATTDHDHLGKLLTYASGYDADIIIWLSTMIRDEHRQALDWLNQRTDSETAFFGVAIEVIKIDDSLPAFRFRVVVSPNEWQRSTKKKNNINVSEKSEKYRNYFQSLLDDLRLKYHFTNAKKGQAQSWYTFASGNKMFLYGHSFTKGNRVRSEIYIDCNDYDENKAFFDKLLSVKEDIEKEFGSSLEWERLDHRRSCRIAVYRNGSIDVKGDDLDEIKEWGIKNLLKLRDVFSKMA